MLNVAVMFVEKYYEMLNVAVIFVDKYYELLSLLLSYSVVVSYYVEQLFLSLLGMLNVVSYLTVDV